MKRLIIISFTVGLLMAGCTVPPPETSAPIEQEVSQENKITGVVSNVKDGDTYDIVISSDYEITSSQNVSEGNEIHHLSAGTPITVRLLLVDTPESVGEKAGMPYGDESSSYAKGLLKDKTVTLEFDEGDIKDKYDRYLAYVYVDGKRAQDYLLENGYAMIRYVNEPNTRYLSELQLIEDKASKQSVGIWSLQGYVVPGEGFNEVGLTPDLNVIGQDIKEKAEEAAEDFFSETIDSLFDSYSSQ